MRWSTAPPHLTLHFFPELDRERVQELVAAVTVAASAIESWRLKLEGAGAFPNWRRPHAVWLGVGQGADRLTELAVRCDRSLDAAGFGAADRAFRAHCTIGRPGPGWREDERLACREHLEGVAFRPFTVDRVVLFESLIGQGPARHLPVAEASLGRRPESGAPASG